MLNDNALQEQDIEQGQFTIDDDFKAEWALSKISEEDAEFSRLIMVCKAKIAEYQDKINTYQERQDSKTSYLKTLLRHYFESVPHKVTKTTESYELPSGKLKLKYKDPEFKRDDKVLGDFLHSGNYEGFYDTVYKPKWAELKKTIAVKDGLVIESETGGVIEGVTAEEREPEFVIEI
jgi:hypothetical protein